MLSHDGHDYPGQGNWFHTIHHIKINCNFGNRNAPFDWLFGTVDYGDDLNMDQQTEKFLRMLEEKEKQEIKKMK